jgi:hypothetical protein
MARQFSRQIIFDEFESLAVDSRRRWRIFEPLLRSLRMRHKTLARRSLCAIASTIERVVFRFDDDTLNVC